MTLVIASFGASLMLRNVVVFVWGPQPEYDSRSISIAGELLPGVPLTADEVFVVVLAAVLMLALHLFLARTRLGKAMRVRSRSYAVVCLGLNRRRQRQTAARCSARCWSGRYGPAAAARPRRCCRPTCRSRAGRHRRS